jgi:hypothetical protein
MPARSSSATCESLEKRQMLAFVVPAMNSLPGAPQTLYLDFDGDPATSWSNENIFTHWSVHGPAGNNDPVPGFDWDGDPANLDGNPSNLTGPEHVAIKQIFDIVAEKYSLWPINVTTVDPGNLTDDVTQKMIIGGRNTDWFNDPSSKVRNSGVSAIGGFSEFFLPNTGYVFSNSYPNNPNFVGSIIAHESGHAFGLVHERWSTNPPPVGNSNYPEYYSGDALRSPIMGAAGNGAARVVWWKTNNFPQQFSPDSIQDELAQLDFNLGPRRPDDWSLPYAPLTLSPDGANFYPVGGIIERSNDVDPWKFTAITSRATITVSGAANGGMLAPLASVRKESGGPYIAANVTTTNTSTKLEFTNLIPGTSYVLDVSSNGEYGSLGQYTITGTMQSFASYNGTTRKLTVGGSVGNNNLSLSRNYSNNSLEVTDSVNGGPLSTQVFNVDGIDSIRVALGNGTDILTVESLFKLGATTAIPVSVDMGGGTNTLRTKFEDNFTTFNIDGDQVKARFPDNSTQTVTSVGVDRIEVYGTTGADTFNLNSMPAFGYPHYYFYGGDDADKLVIGPQVLADFSPSTDFFGQQGNDTMELAASSLLDPKDWFIWSNVVTRHVPDTQSDSNYDSVENIQIDGSAGGNSIQVYELDAGVTANLIGGDGDDGFSVGYDDPREPGLGLAFSDAIRGTVKINGGSKGFDTLSVDDVDYTSLGNYAITQTSIRNTFFSNGIINFDASLNRIRFDGRQGGTTTVTTPVTTQELWLTDAPGISVGHLTIDQRPGLGSAELDLYPDRITNNTGTVNYPQIHYSGFESLSIFTNSITHAVKVFGTSHDIAAGQQTTVTTGPGSDMVTVYPHDFVAPGSASRKHRDPGDLTIATPLGVVGGNGVDTLVVDDTASTLPINYLINNAFGASTQNIFGLGAAGVGALNDVENIVLNAGAGNDIFRVDAYKSGSALHVNGGLGDDTLDVTPVSQDIKSNLTNAAAFIYDGGEGTDAFNLHNANDALPFTYIANTDTLQAIGTGYGSFTFTNPGAEAVAVEGGTVADTLDARTVAAGQVLTLTGGGGTNSYILTNSQGTQGILGAVYVHGGAGGVDSMTVNDAGESTGRTAHLTQSSLGAFPGDDYFGPGGAAYFDSLGSISVLMGSGADTIYAQPNSLAAVTINGGSVEDDALNLALAAAQNYAVNPEGGDGNVTSDNLQTLTYDSFEVGPNIDDAAPTISEGAYNFDAPQPNVTFLASENVSTDLNSGFLTLTNLTTGETVPAGNMLPSFEAATHTIRFVFTGLPNNALPDGNYHAEVPAGLRDLFGNAAATSTPLDFFVLAGDANHDRIVDVSDLGVLATNWQSSDKRFSDGDFNYDGVVDVSDLGILATNWQVSLPPVSGVALSKARPTTPFAQALTRAGLPSKLVKPVKVATPLSAMVELS